jgi:DNA-binding IclR family transcriptional regulator
VREQIQRTLDRLRDSLGAAVYVSRYVDGEVTITQYAAGPDHPGGQRVGRLPLSAHATALGKSLLGQLDHNGRRDHLSRHKMARLTSRTITSDRLLLSRLETQPPTVPCLDLQEYAVGTVCAAVPITAGSSVGCLALSLPVEHAHRLRQAADTLNREARRRYCSPSRSESTAAATLVRSTLSGPGSIFLSPSARLRSSGRRESRAASSVG